MEFGQLSESSKKEKLARFLETAFKEKEDSKVESEASEYDSESEEEVVQVHDEGKETVTIQAMINTMEPTAFPNEDDLEQDYEGEMDKIVEEESQSDEEERG